MTDSRTIADFRKLMSCTVLAGSLAAGLALSLSSVAAGAGNVTMFTIPNQTPISAAKMANAKSVLPLIDVSQIPAGAEEDTGKASATRGSSGSSGAAAPVKNVKAGVTSAPSGRGFGTSNHPFTTKGAYSDSGSTPVELSPWRQAGKLNFVRGGSGFICSASLIKPGLLVTAAHCVYTYATGPFNSSTDFQPARHGASAPYGTVVATNIYIPAVYNNGTDSCTAAGVVCANDVAVVRLASNIGNTVGWYGYATNGFGFTNTKFLGKKAGQITQLGYPGAFDSGLKMIRTDSLGYFTTPSNIIIGSDQTGGSSGGPWLVNFGSTPSSTSSVPSENDANYVVATTSWGAVDSTFKQQGASRFGNNVKFPAPGATNIQSLVDAACADFPGSC